MQNDSQRFLPVVPNSNVEGAWGLDPSYEGDEFHLTKDQQHEVEQQKVKFEKYSELYQEYDTRTTFITQHPTWEGYMISIQNLNKL